jgi:hypothetical protein
MAWRDERDGRQQLERLEARVPAHDSNVHIFADLDRRIGGLQAVVVRGEECRRSAARDDRCQVAATLGKILQEYVDADAKVKGELIEVRYAEWCSDVLTFLSRVGGANDLPHLLHGELRPYFEVGLDRHYRPSDDDLIETYIGDYGRDARARIQSAFSERERGVRANYDAQIEIFEAVLRAAAPCLWARLPEQAAIADWGRSRRRAEQMSSAAAAQIERLQGRRDDSPSSFIRYMLWPYALIAALALKLAKAFAALYVEKGWRRSKKT